MSTNQPLERVTAETYRKHLSTENATAEKLIDEWLFYDVLPEFKNCNQGYEIPKNISKLISLGEFKLKLEQRGFSVAKHADHQGCFVYLSLPPSDE